ncbi:hypothetical protein Pelo_212 [Pelomyxa schiedti]|nr:hypothetical protein Pelo_212 [Pelomyxa schiedti]
MDSRTSVHVIKTACHVVVAVFVRPAALCADHYLRCLILSLASKAKFVYFVEVHKMEDTARTNDVALNNLKTQLQALLSGDMGRLTAIRDPHNRPNDAVIVIDEDDGPTMQTIRPTLESLRANLTAQKVELSWPIKDQHMISAADTEEYVSLYRRWAACQDQCTELHKQVDNWKKPESISFSYSLEEVIDLCKCI